MATIQDRRHKRLEELSVSAARAYVDSGLHGIEAEVVVALDASPPMAPHYASGLVQDVASALLALSMKFDDDGVVPVWTFDQAARPIGEIHRQDYASWVRHNAPVPISLPPGQQQLGACYAPLVTAIGRHYFPSEWDLEGTPRVVGGSKNKRTVIDHPGPSAPRPCPIFVIVVTAGDCADPRETAAALRRASYLPMFWQFAGVGHDAPARDPEPHDDERYLFLQSLNRLGDTHSDCASFFVPEDIVDADALFAGLLNGLPAWLRHDAVQAMLVAPEAPPDVEDQLVDRLLLSLPPHEAARRESIRMERERRRNERAKMAALEIEQAKAWPTVRASAQIDSGEDDPIIRARGDGEPRRAQVGTRPYLAEEEDNAPALPPRRPTVSFSAFAERNPPRDQPAAEADEDAVETAVERLARIRARRNARRSST